MKIDKRTWVDLVMGLLIVLLSISTVILSQQNRSLKSALETEYAPKYRTEVVDSWKANPITVQWPDRHVERIDFSLSDAPTLVFVFSTSCSHCENTLDFWNLLTDHFSGVGCKVLGLSIDNVGETEKYLKEHTLSFRAASVNDSSFRSAYRISGIPHSFIISKDGMIRYTWEGKIYAEFLETMEKDIRKVITEL